MPDVPDDCVRDRAAVLVTADEIDSLTAQTKRPGETTSGMMRTAWLGNQTLGMGYRSSKILCAPHSYRLGFIGGIAHGDPAADFLARKSGGLPWRFLFMPANDPDAADIAVPYQRIVLEDQEWQLRPQLLVYAKPIWAEVRAARLAVLRRAPGTEPVRGHVMMNRLKVAAALTILNNRRCVTEEDWELSGVVSGSDSSS